MPPKRKIKSKRSKRATTTKSSAPDRELQKITQMLANLSKPQNQVTDLGRMLLKGGNMASSMFGFPKIFGSGSYDMVNSCWDAKSQVPIMHSSNESVRFKHREYIADVYMGGSAFTPISYPINPGMSITFPYLAAVAGNFQEYSFKGLVFEYKTTSATALVSGTNTAMGSVMLAAQYRSDAPAFTNKTQLLNEMWSVDTVPSQNVILPIECSPQETVLTNQYVRSGTVTGDIKLFDLASLTVATFGGQSGQTNVIGELWVSYDVEFRKPQLSSVVAGSGANAFYGVSATWSGTSIFNNLLASANSTLAVTATGNIFTFPLGAGGYYYWIVNVTYTGTYAAPSITYSGAHEASNNIFVGSTVGSSTAGTFGQVILVNAPANTQATVTLGSGIPTGTGILTLQVFSLPNNPALWGV
jgi:hypothetical protein